jgi:hypothetical protein
MLIVALILVAVAIIVFTIDFAGWVGRSLISLGLAFFAGSICAWLIDILQAQGKL